MVIILGTIRLESAAEVERFETALRERAARSRTDAGNVDYTFARNLEDPTELRLTEVWESQALLEAHLAKPDPAFDEVLTSAKIARARVTAFDGTNERVLVSRGG